MQEKANREESQKKSGSASRSCEFPFSRLQPYCGSNEGLAQDQPASTKKKKKVPTVCETSWRCLSHGVFSGGLVQVLEGLQLVGGEWLLQQRASAVGTLAVVKRHVVDALHVRL